ncbi:CD81 protein-like [Arapaima gigas]
MGVEGCTKCIKYLLFCFNFIFWLAGGVILGVALWLRHDNSTSNLLSLEFDGAQSPNTFYISIYILIAVGAVMMFVGFLGCYGAIQESQCLLGTFFACLVILFACEVAAGIWGFMNRDTVAEELKNFYDSAFDQAVSDTMLTKKQSALNVIKVYHETLQCCGKGPLSSTFIQAFSDICPKKSGLLNFSVSCHEKIEELFSEKMYLVGIAALVVAVIMIFEMIFSMVLCCGIRNIMSGNEGLPIPAEMPYPFLLTHSLKKVSNVLGDYNWDSLFYLATTKGRYSAMPHAGYDSKPLRGKACIDEMMLLLGWVPMILVTAC